MCFSFFLFLPDAPFVLTEEQCRRGFTSHTLLRAPSSTQKPSRNLLL